MQHSQPGEHLASNGILDGSSTARKTTWRYSRRLRLGVPSNSEQAPSNAITGSSLLPVFFLILQFQVCTCRRHYYERNRSGPISSQLRAVTWLSPSGTCRRRRRSTTELTVPRYLCSIYHPNTVRLSLVRDVILVYNLRDGESMA